tara:strand:- start:2645 stop:2872 length:228 start_codon:yes stop_codon:yes gene_type:complete
VKALIAIVHSPANPEQFLKWIETVSMEIDFTAITKVKTASRSETAKDNQSDRKVEIPEEEAEATTEAAPAVVLKM